MTGGSRSDPFLERATDQVTKALPDVDVDLFRLSFVLTRAANRFARHVESEAHRRRGLSTAGFRILFTLWTSGPLPAHRIAILAGLSRASVSSVVNTLERDGRVERSRDNDDRRVVTVSITWSGAAEVREAYEAQHELERAQYGDLSSDDRRALVAALETLIDTPLDKSLDESPED
jgi:DNA-binding MarR family transcriptional regulator